MSTESTIQSSIDSIDAQIAKLTEARETLVELLEGETENGAVEEKPAKRGSRRSRANEDEDKPARRSGGRTRDKRAAESKSTSRSTSKSRHRNGDDEGTSKKDKIAAMLDEGMAPREIADELGIAPNYVYNVKRSL